MSSFSENLIIDLLDLMLMNNIKDSNAVQGKWYDQRNNKYIKDSKELYNLFCENSSSTKDWLKLVE